MIAAHYLCMWGRSLKGFAIDLPHFSPAPADVSLVTRQRIHTQAPWKYVCVGAASESERVARERK